MTIQEIKLRLFEAIYGATSEWGKEEKEFAEEILKWITKR
jgi:hypothetical protein|tara:strand:- start:2457 stop:2576 length:120 start_codon:yes stop_codon:yes gene_type:complete